MSYTSYIKFGDISSTFVMEFRYGHKKWVKIKALICNFNAVSIPDGDVAWFDNNEIVQYSGHQTYSKFNVIKYKYITRLLSLIFNRTNKYYKKLYQKCNTCKQYYCILNGCLKCVKVNK